MINKSVKSSRLISSLKLDVSKINETLDKIRTTLANDDLKFVNFKTIENRNVTIAPSQVSSVYECDFLKERCSIITLHNSTKFHVYGSTSYVVKKLKIMEL